MDEHVLAGDEESQAKRTKLSETEKTIIENNSNQTEEQPSSSTTCLSTPLEAATSQNTETPAQPDSNHEEPIEANDATGSGDTLEVSSEVIVLNANENTSSPVVRRRSRNLNSRRINLPIIYSSEDEENNSNGPDALMEQLLGDAAASRSGSDLSSLSISSNNSDRSFVLNADGSDTDDSDDSDTDSDVLDGPTSSTKPLEKELSFLSNEKPKHKWNAVREIFYRQNGLTGKGRQNLGGISGSMFQKRVCGSLNSVERLELMFKLQKHRGCVNSLSFHPSGQLLASGSDDLKVILWKWASNEIALAYESGHHSNIFQAKFFGTPNEIHLITTGRDGQVRHATVPSSGGKPYSRALYKHIGAVHKTAINPNNPTEVLTAGEDAHVICYDIRTSVAQRLLTVRENKRKFPLYSIATSPIDNEFCVCGHDQFVRVYDRRNTKVCSRAMCPEKFIGNKRLQVNVTCAVYNYLGNEILATYSDDDIYLFDNKNYEPGKYLHSYSGHSNSSTIKNVNFFGPQSEYIMSGSDCSYIYFWEKETETIVKWMKGDENGVVNCLEPHPDFPFLASSGLDHDVKIWVPSDENPPNLNGLEKKARRNMRSRRTTRDLECHFDDQIFNLLISCRQSSIRRRTTAQASEGEGRILTTTDLASDEEANENEDDSDDEDANDNDDDDNDDNDENLSRRERRGVRRIRRVFPCSPS